MRLLARLIHDCAGAAAAELALILPGTAFIILNVVDLSAYVYEKMQVDLAAHEAVGAARVLCDTAAKLPATVNCGSTLSTSMTAAANSTSLGTAVSLSGTNEAYYCANSGGTLVQVATANGTPPATCSGVVSGSTSAPGIYITTTASFSYTSVFPGASVAAHLTNPIVSVGWMRLK